MKHSKTWVVYLALICLTILLSCSSDSKTLKLSPSKLSFDKVYLGDVKDIELTLTNKYGEEITINSFTINGSSEFTITNGDTAPFTLAKDETHKITVTFEPTSAGDKNGTLEIANTKSTEPKEVKLSGTGVEAARMTISESNIDVGKKLINKSHTHDITVENKGTAVLSVSSLTFSGTDASSFSITAGNAPFDVPINGSQTFTITFSPIAIQTYSANLTIDHNAVDKDQSLICPIVGEGVNLNPQITLSESSPWNFGAVATTIPTSVNLEISNTGTDDLTVTSATLQTNSEFKILFLRDSGYNLINFPYQLAVNEKIYLWIKFAPTAKTTYNDTLSIIHDGTNEPTPLDIALTGTGRDEIVKTFSYTGSNQQFTVPAYVSRVIIEVYGAAGGDGYPFGPKYIGGKGGKVTATFDVTPGITFNIYVGGEGQDGSSSVGGNGGWNGGGKGQFYSVVYCGAGGGGASDIRVGGTAYSNRILVAGGGGGSGNGGMYGGEFGGDGGELTGDKGLFDGMYDPMFCGSGGTQNAGGSAGSGGNSKAGSLGLGGDAINSDNFPGGGGGGGYYGGGGGYVGGGGGGSSFTNPAASSVNHQQGARSGDGEITIRY